MKLPLRVVAVVAAVGGLLWLGSAGRGNAPPGAPAAAASASADTARGDRGAPQSHGAPPSRGVDDLPVECSRADPSMCREWHEGCAHPQVNHSCPHRCGRCPKPTPDAVAQRQAAVLSALEAKVSKVTHGLDRVSGALKLADRKLDALAAEVKTSASKLDTLIDALPSAAPTAAPTAAPRIPRKIHQTWKTREVPSGQATAVASWKSMNPEYAYALYTDSDMERMIKDNYSYIVPAWQRMRPVEKADTFRYAILHQEGGFYSDLDVTCARPIREWLPHVKHDPHTTDLLVGFEVVTERPDWMYWYARKFEFCQWTMGARAGHPVLKLVLDMIVEFYDTHTDAEIADGPQGKPQTVNATGPGIWSDALHRWLNATHGVLFDENKTVAGGGGDGHPIY
mmetsp:Transcript_11325/g.28907  ORF Transcript_11325/g.28907 Transcript_11325/m.28907 type:complete len:396 (-) Transcript_11325:3-1190(-)